MSKPEIAKPVLAGGICAQLHDIGQGPPLLLIHGSGPGCRPGPTGAW
jgi:2-hydroxymuconate-semialdehyde hydrolase